MAFAEASRLVMDKLWKPIPRTKSGVQQYIAEHINKNAQNKHSPEFPPSKTGCSYPPNPNRSPPPSPSDDARAMPPRASYSRASPDNTEPAPCPSWIVCRYSSSMHPDLCGSIVFFKMTFGSIVARDERGAMVNGMAHRCMVADEVFTTLSVGCLCRRRSAR